MNKKKILIILISASVVFFLFLLSILDGPSWLIDFKRSYNSSLLEPLEVFSISSLIAAILILALEAKKVDNWVKYLLSWFLPLSFLVIASGTDGAQFGWLPKTALAQVMGTSLVLVTLGFVIVQTLLPKIKKNKK